MSIPKKYKYRTYRLSNEAIEILEELTEEFSQRLGTQMSLNKVLDSIVKYCGNVGFVEIVNSNRPIEEDEY